MKMYWCLSGNLFTHCLHYDLHVFVFFETLFLESSMKIRNAIVALALGVVVVGAGVGCQQVKNAASDVKVATTGDVNKDYMKTYDQAVVAIDATAKELDAVVVNKDPSKDSDGRLVYTLITRTKDDHQLTFVATGISPEKTHVKIDTAAMSSSDFRKKVEAALDANMAK